MLGRWFVVWCSSSFAHPRIPLGAGLRAGRGVFPGSCIRVEIAMGPAVVEAVVCDPAACLPIWLDMHAVDWVHVGESSAALTNLSHPQRWLL